MTAEELAHEAEHHLPLVGAMLRRIPCAPEDRQEVYQQGCVGLMRALQTWDAARGTFSTYAAAFILGEMRKALREREGLHIPRNARETHRRIGLAQEAWTRTHHQEPTIQELSKELDMEPTEVILHMELPRITSADAPSPDGHTFSDMLPDPEDIEKRIVLRDVLQRLPERDRRLILMRHRLGLNQTETGRRLGMTQMQVSRREAIIRTLLKRMMAED